MHHFRIVTLFILLMLSLVKVCSGVETVVLIPFYISNFFEGLTNPVLDFGICIVSYLPFATELLGLEHYCSIEWKQANELNIDGSNTGDYFGNSVAVTPNGIFMAVGAPGDAYVRVFEKSDPEVPQRRWDPLGSDITSIYTNGRFGFSVAIAYNDEKLYVAVGEIDFENDMGRVGVYQYHCDDDPFCITEWEQKGSFLEGEAAGDIFGYALAFNEKADRLVVTATGGDGYAKVYEFDEDDTNKDWKQLGSTIVGTPGDGFGVSVAFSYSGTIFAVGAPTRQRVHVYERDLDLVCYVPVVNLLCDRLDWTSIYRVSDSSKSNLGQTVALSGDGMRLLAGADTVAMLWDYNPILQTGDLVARFKDARYRNRFSGPSFGRYVALSKDGTIVAIAARGNADDLPGYARVYQEGLIGGGSNIWGQVGNDFGDIDGSYRFPLAMSSDGTVIVLGDRRANSDTGLVREYYPSKLGII